MEEYNDLPNLPNVKIAVVGSGAVGKTPLIIQFVQNHYVDEYDPTIEDSYRKLWKNPIDGRRYALDILDTAGVEEFAAMRDASIRNFESLVLVYSVINREAFDYCKVFYEQMQRAVPVVLVGNMCDWEDRRQVSREEGEALALELGVRRRTLFIELDIW